MTPQEITFYLENGFSIIPILYKTKRPDWKVIRQVTGANEWTPFKERQPTEKEIKHWFDNRKANIGIVTGYNNLAVLDFDNLDTFCEWIKFISLNKQGIFIDIFHRSIFVRTSRGIHIYIKLLENLPRKFGNLDIKGQWGYVLAPPSVHPNGKEYNFYDGHKGYQGYPLPIFEKIDELIPPEWLEKEYESKTIKHVDDMDIWERANEIRPTIGSIDYEYLKMAIPIENLMPPNSNLKQRDKFITGLCPFHQDNSPSFWIDTKTNTCGCFANCFDRPQTVFGFYSKLHDLTINEAIIQLAEISGGNNDNL